MKILFIGDIVGSVGRNIVLEQLPQLKEKYGIDFTIANAENAAHGKGLTKKIYHQLINGGCDLLTLGNHAYSKDTIFTFLEEADQLVRPYNLSCQQGKGYRIVEVNGLRICVTNLIGEIFMIPTTESPFMSMEDIIMDTRDEVDIYFVDLHAEATSEKIAFSYYFESDVQVVVGTHTHVQTADERVSYGTAFISDVGMCGAYRSVIGRDIEEIITRFTTDEKTRFTIAEGPGILSAVVVEIDETSKQATHIERIQIRPESM